MEQRIETPAWLEPCRPGDDLFANAYENTSPERRALLKTALAFAFHRWPGRDGCTARSFQSFRRGFRHTECRRAADWVLACLGSGYASPARFLAPIASALAAGVGRVIAVSAREYSPALCTALELAGVEDSFVVEENRLPGLYGDLRSASFEGRLLVFPDENGAFSPTQKALWHRATEDGIPLLIDRPFPVLLSLYAPGPTAEALALRLHWLYPDAELVSQPTVNARIAFAPGEKTLLPGFRGTVLGPGMEACWPGPSPDFFRSSTCSAFLFTE